MKTFKKDISLFFEYNWLFVILIALLSYLSVSYPISLMNAYKDYEQFNMFLEVENVVDTKLPEDIKNDIAPKIINDVNVYAYSPSKKDIATLYTAFGERSDLLILREKDLVDMNSAVEVKFKELTADFKDQVFKDLNKTDYEFYAFESKEYAIKIYDKDNEAYNNKFAFNKWVEFKKDYDNFYLMFNYESIKFEIEPTKPYESIGFDIVNEMLKRYSHEK